MNSLFKKCLSYNCIVFVYDLSIILISDWIKWYDVLYYLVLQAGVASPDHPEQLVIALEPEAASIYCRRLRMNQLVPNCPQPMQPLTLERNRKLLDMPELVEDKIGDHLEIGKQFI